MNNAHTGDPIFARDGYHLTGGSATIHDSVDEDVAMDVDGQARPYGVASDLGADE